MSKPLTLIELFTHQMDTGHGADSEHPLTQELVEAFSKCDLLVTAVVDRLLEEDPESGFFKRYAYGHADRSTELGDGRERLAKMFGEAYDRDLEDRTAANLRAAKSAGEAADKAKRELWEAQDTIRILKEKINQLEPVIGY